MIESGTTLRGFQRWATCQSRDLRPDSRARSGPDPASAPELRVVQVRFPGLRRPAEPSGVVLGVPNELRVAVSAALASVNRGAPSPRSRAARQAARPRGIDPALEHLVGPDGQHDEREHEAPNPGEAGQYVRVLKPRDFAARSELVWLVDGRLPATARVRRVDSASRPTGPVIIDGQSARKPRQGQESRSRTGRPSKSPEARTDSIHELSVCHNAPCMRPAAVRSTTIKISPTKVSQNDQPAAGRCSGRLACAPRREACRRSPRTRRSRSSPDERGRSPSR